METMTEPKTEQQAPICATQKCKKPLTRLGPPQNCWRCLVCNPIAKTAPTVKKKDKYIDVKLTKEMVREIIKEELSSVSTGINEEKIREIVIDEMANWHIQKPPVTRDEIAEATGASEPESNVHIDVQVPTVKPETWRQRAKELGVPLHKEPAGSGMRKKEDVLADMARLGEPSQETEETEESPKGDMENPPATVEKGA